ncbi:MAG: SbcC/MukB-like Walker B domain-containing protein, partial [Desulfobulbaceae bacterium]|nr:SbcC/MukB-like Walker B domain-containing protein [Desulfobulbaceae bacterium]
LRHFFEDHRQEIINTEVGNIPEELDYRNWYRYEMEVTATGDHGVVMDRRNKSIGSGGEQAVPNYLLVLTIAHFLYHGKKVKLHTLLFDEAFYGIDAGRRDQLLGFATDLGLQLFVASPDQDGVRREISYSTTILVKKDTNFDIHLYPYHWQNPDNVRQIDLFAQPQDPEPIEFGEEL